MSYKCNNCNGWVYETGDTPSYGDNDGDCNCFMSEPEVVELKARVKEQYEAVKKHFLANCTLNNYPNYNDSDVELWKTFEMGGYKKDAQK